MNPYIRELRELVDTMRAGLEKLPPDSPYIERVRTNIEETMQEIDYLIEQDELARARWQEQRAEEAGELVEATFGSAKWFAEAPMIDPRSPSEIAQDEWQADTQDTLKSVRKDF